MPLSYSKPFIVMCTLREYKDTMMRSLSHYTLTWILYSPITFATKLRAWSLLLSGVLQHVSSVGGYQHSGGTQQ